MERLDIISARTMTLFSTCSPFLKPPCSGLRKPVLVIAFSRRFLTTVEATLRNVSHKAIQRRLFKSLESEDFLGSGMKMEVLMEFGMQARVIILVIIQNIKVAKGEDE